MPQKVFHIVIGPITENKFTYDIISLVKGELNYSIGVVKTQICIFGLYLHYRFKFRTKFKSYTRNFCAEKLCFTALFQ